MRWLVLAAALIAAGCEDHTVIDTWDKPAESHNVTVEPEIGEDGILYFNTSMRHLSTSIHKWMLAHPEHRIVSLSAIPYGGESNGFFVVVEESHKEESCQ